jgi:lysophospholipase D
LSYFTGLLPFLPLPNHAFQIPLFTAHFFQWKQREWKNPVKSYLFFAGLRVMNVLLVPLLWHLRRRGVMTFYWVCNSEEEFDRALSLGASGIITDEPFLLREYLRNRKVNE